MVAKGGAAGAVITDVDGAGLPHNETVHLPHRGAALGTLRGLNLGVGGWQVETSLIVDSIAHGSLLGMKVILDSHGWLTSVAAISIAS